MFVPNPIDAQACEFNADTRAKKIAELGAELSVDLNNKTIIGTATAFMPYKNPLFLIDVFAQYLKLNSNAYLLVAGDGPMRNEVEAHAKQKLTEGTYRILGKRDDVAQLLQAYDSFVLPSKNEGLPLCIMEAQAADLPCFMATSITDEAIVLKDRVARLSLKSGPEVWANALNKTLNASEERRSTTAKIVSDAGFNLNSPAKILPYLTSAK